MNLKYDTFSTVSTTLSNIQTEINNLETLKGQINSLETDISEISGALQAAKKAVISAIDSVIDDMKPAIQKVNDAIADLQAYEAKAANSNVLNKELKVEEVAPATSATTTIDTTQNSLIETLKPFSQTTPTENGFVGINVTETKQQTSTNSNYTIKSGDTLSEIAKANNTTVEELMKANPDITNPNFILAGASMIIPNGGNKNIAQNVESSQKTIKDNNSEKSEVAQNTTETNTHSSKTTSQTNNNSGTKYNNKEALGFKVTTNNKTYSLSDEDFDFLCAVVAAESDRTPDDSLAVVSTVLNRCEDSWHIKTFGKDPISQVVATGQYDVVKNKSYLNYIDGNYPDSVKNSVQDALNGTRNCNYLFFRSNDTTDFSSNLITSSGNRFK